MATLEVTNKNLAYLIDGEDKILDIFGPWKQFSDQNGGTINSVDVCGKSIWEFISGDITRMWLEVVFQKARLLNQTIEKPYRCDSPNIKRYMKMRVVPEGNQAIRVENILISTESRSQPVHIMHFDNSEKKSYHLRCSMCGCIKSNSTWVEPDIMQMREFAVVYTICSYCKTLLP